MKLQLEAAKMISYFLFQVNSIKSHNNRSLKKKVCEKNLAICKVQSIKVKTILLSHFLLKIRELLSFVGRAERARFASPQPTQKLLVVLKERCELSRIGIRVQCQNVYCSIIKAALVFLRSTSTNISKGCFAMIFILKRETALCLALVSQNHFPNGF